MRLLQPVRLLHDRSGTEDWFYRCWYTMPEFLFTPQANPVLPVFCKSVNHESKSPILGWRSCSTAQAVISKGTIYVSGNIGCDKDMKIVGDIKAQTVTGFNHHCEIWSVIWLFTNCITAGSFGKHCNCFEGSWIRFGFHCQSQYLPNQHGSGFWTHEWGLRRGIYHANATGSQAQTW